MIINHLKSRLSRYRLIISLIVFPLFRILQVKCFPCHVLKSLSHPVTVLIFLYIIYLTKSNWDLKTLFQERHPQEGSTKQIQLGFVHKKMHNLHRIENISVFDLFVIYHKKTSMSSSPVVTFRRLCPWAIHADVF